MISNKAEIAIFNVGEEYNGMYGMGIPSDLEKFIRNPISQKILNEE